MTKTLRKPVTMLLALCMVFTLAVGACADDAVAQIIEQVAAGEWPFVR